MKIFNINIKPSTIIAFAMLPLWGLVGSSCSDLTETKPLGQITPDQIDASAIEGIMASSYQGLEAHYFSNNEAFQGPSTNWIFDVRSDDALAGFGTEAWLLTLENNEIDPTNSVCFNKWQNNFYAITTVNKAIEEVEACSLAEKDQFIGELKALRAWFYFDLIRIFKNIPYYTNAEESKVASNTEFTRDQILDKIEADLTEAIGVLPTPKSTRITKTTAQAILARVALYRGEWAKVIEMTNAVIASNQYALFENFGYISKQDHNNGSESVFALQVSSINTGSHHNWSNLLNCTYSGSNKYYGDGDDFFHASQDLVNCFRTDDNTGLPILDESARTSVNVTVTKDICVDPRLDYTVGRVGMPWKGITYTEDWIRDKTYSGYSCKKFVEDPAAAGGPAATVFPWGYSDLNFMFIRYSEILLMKAEALIESATKNNAAEEVDGENLREARKLINQIRQRAKNSIDNGGQVNSKNLDKDQADYYVELYPSATTEDNLFWTKEKARQALRMERRIELAMEGQRWFDLQRYGEAQLVSTMNKYYENESKLRGYLVGKSIQNPQRLFMPISQTEIDNSKGLYTQDPAYK